MRDGGAVLVAARVLQRDTTTSASSECADRRLSDYFVSTVVVWTEVWESQRLIRGLTRLLLLTVNRCRCLCELWQYREESELQGKWSELQFWTKKTRRAI